MTRAHWQAAAIAFAILAVMAGACVSKVFAGLLALAFVYAILFYFVLGFLKSAKETRQPEHTVVGPVVARIVREETQS